MRLNDYSIDDKIWVVGRKSNLPKIKCPACNKIGLPESVEMCGKRYVCDQCNGSGHTHGKYSLYVYRSTEVYEVSIITRKGPRDTEISYKDGRGHIYSPDETFPNEQSAKDYCIQKNEFIIADDDRYGTYDLRDDNI